MTNEKAQVLLDEIDEMGVGLTEFEINFVDSMLIKTDGGYVPTETEARKIREIYFLRVKG